MSREKVIVVAGLCTLVLLGVLAALAQTAEKPPTELYVRTSPPNAEVVLDGKNQGRSPALFAVEPGDHTITVKLEGYGPQTRTVTIREGRIRRVILELQKGPDARDGEPKPAGAEAPWGKAVEGVQCRLRADKSVWRPGEVPTFKAEIRNRGTRSLRVAASQEGGTLVLDGKTYHWPGFQFVEALPLHPGSGYDVPISLVNTWFGGRPATLAPGAHKLSVQFQCLGVGKQSDKLVALVESNTVEFEIRPTGATPPGDREKAQAAETEVRRVVESFLAAAIAGRSQEAIRMTNPARAVGRQLEDIRKMAGAAALRVARVSVTGNAALAVTTQVKDHGDHESVLLIRLISSGSRWVVEDIDLISIPPFEIKFMPPPELPSAGPAWGEPVEGVRVRLRASRTVWSATDVPTFTIDLASEKQRPLPYGPVHDEFQLQFDGTWYRHVGPDIRSLAASPATRREGIHLALSRPAWRQTPGGPLLDLAPGRHTVRVAFLLADGAGQGREPARAVSNAVEIDIVPAEARPKASEREPAWGEQVENLQCRLRAEKATWTAGTVPKLFGDLRSYDMWQPDLSSVSEDWEIEIDGRWHKNQRAKLLGSHCYRMLFLSSLSAEHDAQEVVYQLAIDAEQTAARSLRALAPGKHVLRAGYQFDALPPDAAKVMSAVKEVLGPHGFSRSGKAVHVVSNPIEIEIVAAEAAAPSGVSGEVKLSPRKLMSTSVGKDMGVLAVAFSPSGKTLATVDEAGQVRLHNARAGTETLSFNLLTAQEREAIFRDARRQKILTGGIAFSPSGMVLAVGGGPVVKLYDVADGRLDLTFVDKRLVEAPSPPAPLPEGEGSRKPSLPALLPAGGARGESPSKPSAVPYAHGQVFCVAFSPDGTLLATSGDVVREVGEDTGATPGHLKLWNVKTGELKRDLGDYYPSVRSVAFSPDGKTLASVGTHPPDGTCSVRLWDPQTGTVKRVLRIDHGSIPWSVAFSPDGKLLAACALVNEDDRDGRLGERGCKLLAWNAQTGTPLCTRPAPGLAQLSFSADSKILAAGVDGRGVTLWDPETLTPKGEIQLSKDPPREVQVAFSPIGSLLAVGAKDAKQGGFITVWEIGRGEDHPE